MSSPAAVSATAALRDEARPPRPAATLVVVRDAPAGIEVLLLLRAERGDHNSGAWVFPGGLVDAADRDAHACCSGLDDATASARLHLPQGGLDYHLAALRECFEECGLLFADDAEGVPLGADAVARLQPWRMPLHRGEQTLAAFCADNALRFAVDRLAYLSHWLTPLGRAKRFDARFFIAEAPAGQAALHDGVEMTAHRWIRPADALAQGDALKLMGPTRATLQTLAGFDSARAAMAWARSPREVPRIFPRIGLGAQGERPVMPHEFAWAELGRLDPQGRGDASYDIAAERPVRLSARVVRVTAGNRGVMTGPGTNSYLVGAGDDWAVIDPGPRDEAHVQALIDAAPGTIRRILVTHTHSDHSPAATLLKARTGAATCGRIAAHPDRQDTGFVPDRPLAGGERIVLGGEATLQVIHTPGHASNHLCYLLEEEKTLFTGDHVMQSSTVVINPPDGDMAAYLASLRALADRADTQIDWLAPGHGFLMAQPRRAFEAIVAHRLAREAKVLQALRAAREGTLASLLPRVYDDVPAGLHVVAMRSLLAHLLKLRDDGLAREAGGVWSPCV
jgi:glyoxylase-like metal-dependent hydrolase (beta-lactamase superfamily II)/8-oxo-dGTP pyrophosphatase MutT (NUDIX family)